jgi:hypothetical protein
MIVATIGIAFSTEVSKKVLLAFPEHGYTELSVGMMIQKINPMLRMDFRKYKLRPLSFYWPQDSQYLLHNYDLTEKLRQIDLTSGEVLEVSLQKQARP